MVGRKVENAIQASRRLIFDCSFTFWKIDFVDGADKPDMFKPSNHRASEPSPRSKTDPEFLKSGKAPGARIKIMSDKKDNKKTCIIDSKSRSILRVIPAPRRWPMAIMTNVLLSY